MKLFVLPLGVLALAACMAVTAAEVKMTAEEIAKLRADAKELIGVLPEQMPGAEKDTLDMVRLGQKLYFDNRLSTNNSQSCNTCHVVDKGGVDGQPTSPGAFGKRGDRNSPTVLNAGFQFAQFWDGRAATLEDQAKGPILNPVEMAMPDEATVLKRLNADAVYPGLFKKAFPEEQGKMTYDLVARAIAAFERTLITQDRFDAWQKGNDQALSALEVDGLKTFLSIGCTTCHNGPVIGGNSYQKMGLVNAYEHQKDEGRSVITKEDDDKYKFKVPILRNIAITGPYFHDGKYNDLDKVVRRMSWMQLGRELTDAEAKSLVAFLQSLTGKPRT